MLCVMNIYIYIQSDVFEYRPGMSAGDSIGERGYKW